MLDNREVESLSEKARREIGQHFVFGFHGDTVSKDIERLIKEYFVGNVILMRRNVRSFAQVREITQSLQRIAFEAGHRQPLLIGIDQENGLVSAFSSVPSPSADFGTLSNRADIPLADHGDDFDPHASCGTLFPGALALASAGQPSITDEVYSASAKEMKLAGINWVYAPVADVNTNSLNPVIGVRSFGDDAHKVAKYVQAAAHGLSSGGICPCAKHFPGHGDTHVDSHLALPVIDKSLAELTNTELVPFGELIRDGSSSNEAIASIMTAHVSLPTLLKDLSSKEDPNTPASLSRSVNSSLLRDKLGYKGVITTDCLEMDAISGGPTSVDGVAVASVKALDAGADIVMICHRIDRQEAALKETYEAVRKGHLGLKQLEESSERISIMKEKFAGRWEDVLQQGRIDIGLEDRWKALKSAHRNLASRVRAASLAWIPLSTPFIAAPTDQITFSPIPITASVLLLTPQQESVNAAVDDDAVAKESGWSSRTKEANTPTRKEDKRSVDSDAAGVVSAASVRAGAAYLAFAKALASHTESSSHFVYSANTLSNELGESDGKLIEFLGTSDVVVFTTRNAHTSLWQLEVLSRVARFLKSQPKDGKALSRLCLVASCAPYDYLPFKYGGFGSSGPLIDTEILRDLSTVLVERCSPAAALCSFEFTEPALRAIAAALYGEVRVTGSNPVQF